MQKHIEYAIKINEAIASIFDEDSEYHIALSELEEDDNCTEFIHALANIAPTRIFNKITGGGKNILEFNHIANTLVFQFHEPDKGGSDLPLAQ